MKNAGILTSKYTRHNERGVSFLLVVAGIFALLGMAALAIDLVTLYTAKSEAQKAADAAALAGAKMFVATASTSGVTTGICTNGAAGTTLANVAAAAAAAANTIQGVAAAISNVACGGTGENPQMTVTVARTDLPLFFARIFGQRVATVSAKAKAEAFNNSGGGASVLSVGSVKPWAIPNCDPTVALPGAPCGTGYFVNTSGYALNSPATYVGTSVALRRLNGAIGKYYAIDFSSSTPAIQANVCPVTGTGDCDNVAFGAAPYYVDNIACSTTNLATQRLSCGSNITLLDPAPLNTATSNATQCLIHSDGGALGDGQDVITPTGAGSPPTIGPGTHNPNSGFAGATNISRSDSIVTVPLFTWTGTNPCATNPCSAVQVIGFLQLGIQDVTAGGRLNAVIINAVGCDPGNPGSPPVSGGGLTPIPVRLVQ
jgi:Flp pilus assembly protein TadG